jgi:hypothetical protein
MRSVKPKHKLTKRYGPLAAQQLSTLRKAQVISFHVNCLQYTHHAHVMRRLLANTAFCLGWAP